MSCAQSKALPKPVTGHRALAGTGRRGLCASPLLFRDTHGFWDEPPVTHSSPAESFLPLFPPQPEPVALGLAWNIYSFNALVQGATLPLPFVIRHAFLPARSLPHRRGRHCSSGADRHSCKTALLCSAFETLRIPRSRPWKHTLKQALSIQRNSALVSRCPGSPDKQRSTIASLQIRLYGNKYPII